MLFENVPSPKVGAPYAIDAIEYNVFYMRREYNVVSIYIWIQEYEHVMYTTWCQYIYGFKNMNVSCIQVIRRMPTHGRGRFAEERLSSLYRVPINSDFVILSSGGILYLLGLVRCWRCCLVG